jgi:hypothetical protein
MDNKPNYTNITMNEDMTIKIKVYSENIIPKTQSKGLNRDTTDKYYTNNSIVDLCYKSIKNHININIDDDIVIEPSAGNGAFIDKIKLLCNNYKFYDILPDNNVIVKQDYLNLDVNQFKNFSNKHIIGNPPFGRQSTFAIKFIKKSCKFCNTISFILPKSFKKDSLKKHFPLNFHLIHEQDLPGNSFNVNGDIYNVPCIFQIWMKKSEKRSKPEKPNPVNFKFVKKTDSPHISFRRVGVYAGKIDKSFEDKSTQSHYFIKFEIPFNDEIFQELQKINFDCRNNTVGPKSISKPELIKKYNPILTN